MLELPVLDVLSARASAIQPGSLSPAFPMRGMPITRPWRMQHQNYKKHHAEAAEECRGGKKHHVEVGAGKFRCSSKEKSLKTVCSNSCT